MEDEEVLNEIKKVTKQVEAFKNTLAEKVSKEDVDKVSAQIKALEENFKTMQAEKVGETVSAIKASLEKFQTQVEEMNESVNVLKDRGSKGGAKKSIGQLVVDKVKDLKLDGRKIGKSEHINFDIDYVVNKTVGTMTTANVIPVGTDSIPFSLSEAESGLTRIVRRRPWILNIANTSTTSKKYVQWAEQTGVEGGAAPTDEGDDKNQIDFDWTEKSAEVVKYTAFVKVSKESLDDLDGLAAEIDAELLELVMLDVDADLLSGNGVAPTLNGILNQDTAYSAGSFAGTIVDPNFFDVLRTAIAQVVTENFIPNYILLNPNDVAKMDLTKSSSDGHYVMPPFKSANGMVISGVNIIENTGQTVDKFTVGDFTKLNVKVREGFNIDIGHDGNDFTKNLLTVIGEVRLVAYIKANHAKAFVSGDFSDAIASLAASA